MGLSPPTLQPGQFQGDVVDKSQAGLVVISSRRAINPRDPKYGAKGDGNSANVAADTAGLQLALIDGFNTGRKVTPGDGIYYVNAKLGSSVGTGAGIALPLALEGEGFGKTIFRRTADVRFLDILGNRGSSAAVSGSVQPGDTTVTLGSGLVSARGIAAGNLILLTSSKLWFSATDSTSTYGEYLKVKSVSGDVITISGYVEEQYLTGDTPLVWKVTPSSAPYVGGITFEGTAGAGGAGALLVQYARDVDIDVQGVTLDGSCVSLQDCVGGHSRSTARDLSDDAASTPQRLGYGQILSGATRDIEVNTRLHGGRHAFTTGGSANGVPRHINATVYGRECTQAVADTHEPGRFIHFPLIHAESTIQAAAKMRAPDTSIGKLIARRCGDAALHSAGSATGLHVDSIHARSVGLAAPAPALRLGGDDAVLGFLDIDGCGEEGVLFRGARPRVIGGGRIANPGQVTTSKKRCFATAASGSETGDAWNGASDVLIPARMICENADYGAWEHATGVIAEANIVPRSLATGRTNRAGMELMRRIDEAGQGSVVLPRFGADENGGRAPTANQAKAVRFMPVRDFSLVSIGFIVDAVGGAGDSCEVALLSSNHTLLAVSPATTGKLNSAGQQKIALTGGPFALTAGTVYYLVLLVTSLTAGLKLGNRLGGSAAGSMNPFGVATPNGEVYKQNSVTTVTGWSPSLSADSGAPMLLPLET